MTLQSIIAELPRLSEAERGQLLQAIKALGSVSPVETSLASDTDQEMILSCISQVMQEEAGEYPFWHMLRQAAKSAAFRAKVGPLMQFIRSVSPQRTVQRGVLVSGYRLLFKHMHSRGYVVSARTLLAHTHRLPSVLNQAYPNYARAGMLHWIVRGRT